MYTFKIRSLVKVVRRLLGTVILRHASNCLAVDRAEDASFHLYRYQSVKSYAMYSLSLATQIYRKKCVICRWRNPGRIEGYVCPNAEYFERCS